MLPTLILSAWLWLCPPNPGGCVPVPYSRPAVETAPMPRQVVPVIGLPTPVGGAREVRPWRPRTDG